MTRLYADLCTKEMFDMRICVVDKKANTYVVSVPVPTVGSVPPWAVMRYWDEAK